MKFTALAVLVSVAFTNALPLSSLRSDALEARDGHVSQLFARYTQQGCDVACTAASPHDEAWSTCVKDCLNHSGKKTRRELNSSWGTMMGKMLKDSFMNSLKNSTSNATVGSGSGTLIGNMLKISLMNSLMNSTLKPTVGSGSVRFFKRRELDSGASTLKTMMETWFKNSPNKDTWLKNSPNSYKLKPTVGSGSVQFYKRRELDSGASTLKAMMETWFKNSPNKDTWLKNSPSDDKLKPTVGSGSVQFYK